MFSSTGYEAFYQYLGLALHSEFIKIITSQKVFMAVLLLIFGVMFFLACVRFFSRYMPGTLVLKKSTPLSTFVKLVACLFLGISLLKVQSNTMVKKFNNVSWHSNDYIEKKIPAVRIDYQVSFLFDLMIRSAEEVTRFLSTVVDKIFKKTNSQLQSPSFFYKAIMLGSSETIEDQELRAKIELYTDQCFEKALPFMEDFADTDILDRFFGRYPDIDAHLRQFKIDTPSGAPMTCFDLKEEMRTHLLGDVLRRRGLTLSEMPKHLPNALMNTRSTTNMWLSQWLVNHQHSKREEFLGLQKGAKLPGTAPKILKYIHRFFSFEGQLHLWGLGRFAGIGTALERAEKFHNDLSRAPHIAGFVKMILIMIFPFLVFFVVAGRWKVLVYWYLIYCSVLLWTPIWTLFYHIITNIALSADVMASFGKLNDGVSLYSASLITSRIYKMYSIYSWVQDSARASPHSIFSLHFCPNAPRYGK